MYLFYVDEAGDPGDPRSVKSPTNNLVLSGLAIHEGQWRQVAGELDDLQEKYFPGHPDPIEFRSYDIRHGCKSFSSLSEDERAELTNDMYLVIRRYKHGPILFAIDVDKRTLAIGEHPYTRAFEELYSRFDLFLKRKFWLGDPQKGILVFDNLSLRQRIMRQVVEFHKFGTRWSPVENMIEAPFFLDSKITRVVQMTDFVASAVFQYYENRDDVHLGSILRKFDRERGKIHGLVHITGDRKCACIACAQRL